MHLPDIGLDISLSGVQDEVEQALFLLPSIGVSLMVVYKEVCSAKGVSLTSRDRKWPYRHSGNSLLWNLIYK